MEIKKNTLKTRAKFNKAVGNSGSREQTLFKNTSINTLLTETKQVPGEGMTGEGAQTTCYGRPWKGRPISSLARLVHLVTCAPV